MAYFIWSYYWF